MLLRFMVPILCAPEEGRRDFSPGIPGFADKKRGEASEDKVDERKILGDGDSTGPTPMQSFVKRFNMTDTALEPLEDLPADFMRGEVDVKRQMDLAADALDSSLRGLPSQSDESSPRGELGASFRDTPGGIEEAAAKTDEYLATHAHHLKEPRMGVPKRKKLRGRVRKPY